MSLMLSPHVEIDLVAQWDFVTEAECLEPPLVGSQKYVEFTNEMLTSLRVLEVAGHKLL